jgi:glutaredoxin 3
MANVSIYTTPTCSYCKAAKEFFKEHNIEFDEYNVAVDASKRQEMIEKSGQMGVPVIMVKKDENSEPEMVVGFDQSKLEAMLDIS